MIEREAPPCPSCGQASASDVTDRRFDAQGEHEKTTYICRDGHTWSAERSIRPEARLVAPLRAALTRRATRRLQRKG